SGSRTPTPKDSSRTTVRNQTSIISTEYCCVFREVRIPPRRNFRRNSKYRPATLQLSRNGLHLDSKLATIPRRSLWRDVPSRSTHRVPEPITFLAGLC